MSFFCYFLLLQWNLFHEILIVESANSAIPKVIIDGNFLVLSTFGVEKKCSNPNP